MSFPHRFYMDHMNSHTGYRANWLPDQPLRIGDIGKLEDGLFRVYTTLEQQQLTFTTRESKSALALDYTSSDSAHVDFNLDTGSTNNALVKGKINISFTKKDGVVFQMTEAKTITIDNLASIEKTVLSRYSSNDWPKE